MYFLYFSFSYHQIHHNIRRTQTQGDIQNKGIISGIYSSRLNILNKHFKESNIQDIIAGKPGIGTNTACNKVTSKVTSEECQTTDSLFTTSLVSFGIIGFLFIYSRFNSSYK